MLSSIKCGLGREPTSLKMSSFCGMLTRLHSLEGIHYRMDTTRLKTFTSRKWESTCYQLLLKEETSATTLSFVSFESIADNFVIFPVCFLTVFAAVFLDPTACTGLQLAFLDLLDTSSVSTPQGGWLSFVGK